jgi:hypothetical protein
MKITHLQANSLFELASKYGVPVSGLYLTIKKRKGIIKGVLVYDNILLNQYQFKRRFEIDQQGNVYEEKAKIKKKGV